MTSKNARVQLEWVLYAGHPVHVSTFKDLPVGSRPEVICLACGERLTLRLGKLRAWHAAHQQQTTCALSSAETLLHFNAKHALAARLRGLEQLDIQEPCIGLHDGRVRAPACDRHRTRTWLEGWEHVEVEHKVRSRRPDLSLLVGDEALGAIEVHVSHAIDPEKQRLYAEWGLPWIEVSASALGIEEHEEDHQPLALPLLVERSGPEDPYVCPACAALGEQRRAAGAARIAREAEAHRLRQEGLKIAQARLEAEERELQREEAAARDAEKVERAAFTREASTLRQRLSQNGAVFRHVQVFDRFGPERTQLRSALIVADVFKDGIKQGSFLADLDGLQVIQKVLASTAPDALAYLKPYADRHLSNISRSGYTVDSTSEWLDLSVVLQSKAFRSRWTWEGKDHRWPRPEKLPSPWTPEGTLPGVDCLDLMRFLLVRYWSGLPTRYCWAPQKQRWFQPPVLREEAWRLWPEETTQR